METNEYTFKVGDIVEVRCDICTGLAVVRGQDRFHYLRAIKDDEYCRRGDVYYWPVTALRKAESIEWIAHTPDTCPVGWIKRKQICDPFFDGMGTAAIASYSFDEHGIWIVVGEEMKRYDRPAATKAFFVLIPYADALRSFLHSYGDGIWIPFGQPVVKK